MIDATAPLSITHQCTLLAISRASYYRSRAPRSADVDVMLKQTLTSLYERHPYYGSRRLQLALADAGWAVGIRQIRRLMRELRLAPLHPQPRTSVPNKAHKTHPYVLRGHAIDASNEVWAADITYIPMARGHVYVVAIMDWHRRRVLAWRLSNTLDAGFCVDASQDELQRFGKPTIFNTDQGSQFTSEAFLNVLRSRRIQISMDGQGRWRDNVMIERLWRSLKYECVLLHAFQDPHEARQRIGTWFDFYNDERPHQALGNRTPVEVYENDLKKAKHAA